MRLSRSLSAAAVVAVLLVWASGDALAAGEPSPALVELVSRSLSEGTCIDDGPRAICSLTAVVRSGPVRDAGGDRPQPPYEAVHLIVVVSGSVERLLVEEVFGLRERGERDGDTTVVHQVLVPLWGPRRGHPLGRRLRFDGPVALGIEEFPPTREDVRAIGDLLSEIFLSARA